MIAAFALKETVHIIRWTGRVRLHAGAVAYCGTEVDASHGVIQVPDAVVDHGASYMFEGAKLKACAQCRMAVQASIS